MHTQDDHCRVCAHARQPLITGEFEERNMEKNIEIETGKNRILSDFTGQTTFTLVSAAAVMIACQQFRPSLTPSCFFFRALLGLAMRSEKVVARSVGGRR